MEQKKQIPPRPMWNDEMNRELIQFTIGQIEEWDNNDHSIGAIPDFFERFTSTHKKQLYYMDGFEIAYFLHNECPIYADTDLVLSLDKVAPQAETILNEAVTKWVKDNDIKPKFNNGHIIRVSIDGGDKVPKTIASRRKKTAEYVVYGAERQRIIIPFEDVHSLEAE